MLFSCLLRLKDIHYRFISFLWRSSVHRVMKEEVMKENSYQVQGIGSGGSLLKSFRRAPISKRSGIHPSSTFFSRNISN